MSTITRGDPPALKNVRKSIFHHYVRVDEPRSLIYVSGQVSRDADGAIVGCGDIRRQTRQCIQNMQTVLEAAGATLDNVVSLVVYTTDITKFSEIAAVRSEFFSNSLPTSTLVEVSRLAEPEFLIEFQAVAAL